MGYVIRRNATPPGTAIVRMDVAAGSLDEAEDERGFAHFVEHMAFNGSTHVPEGAMIPLLERSGLAFGADTNASTGFDRTLYMLDLPRADPLLLDTALMLMRETASELTFSPQAVDRERGVIFAEKRDRNSYQLRNLESQLAFLYPRARYARRLPIGTDQTLNTATAERLRAFWQREYVPAQTTLTVIGDFDPAVVEQAISKHFQSWRSTPARQQPDAGPVEPPLKGKVSIYLDPALSERVTATRHGAYQDEPDTTKWRRETTLRQLGYAMINRRLARRARQTGAPFDDAGFGTANVFRSGRSTNLIIETVDGQWRKGIIAAVSEYRQALTDGFTQAELDEQLANLTNAAKTGAAGAATRHNRALYTQINALIRDQRVPTTPQSALDRLEGMRATITPASVLAALRGEAVPLKEPLLRFQGKTAPAGGAAALQAAWDDAWRSPLTTPTAISAKPFGYTDFGPAGAVVGDAREPLLGIRTLRFANGVRLNIKPTTLEQDRVTVMVSIDGGERLNTKTDPLATAMISALAAGGLGKHSTDEVQSIAAGRNVTTGIVNTPETFVMSAQTTPRDVELQLQLMAALVTDPGYRPEGIERYRQGINAYFNQLRATPAAALNGEIGRILSDDDPRFSLHPVEAYRQLTFTQLKTAISDRLAKGAIEIGVVGDISEDTAIGLVARTFGALPSREPEFRRYPEQRQRGFTADRSPRIVHHQGPADQALIRLTWPTRDDSDPVMRQRFNLLERVIDIMLTDKLREKLGKAYSPGASSQLANAWDGYGIFLINASVAVADIDATRSAIAEALAELRTTPVSDDLIQRARQPLLESYGNILKTNSGWLSLVDRAQTEANRLERHIKAKERLQAVTASQLQELAQRYLTANGAVEVTVLPQQVAGASATK